MSAQKIRIILDGYGSGHVFLDDIELSYVTGISVTGGVADAARVSLSFVIPEVDCTVEGLEELPTATRTFAQSKGDADGRHAED
jgi:hypothetical protein